MSGDYYWVVFYEPDGKGSRRLCRWEYWINRLPYRNAKVTPPSVPAQYELNPVLKPWTRDYLRSVIRQYVYAADGRLAWTGSSDYSTDKWVHYPLQCYFYDQQGRPSRTVKVNPQLDALRQITSSCQARTSGEATLLDYFYDSRTGAYRGMRNQASAVLHGTDDEESRKAFREKPAVPNQVTWDYRPDGKDYIVKGEWQPRSNNNFTDEVKFETTFEAETVPGRKNRWRPHDEQTYFRYYLYDPALVLSVQAKDDPIAELKRLHRLRVQNWGAGPVYEHFTPQGILRHRLFTLGGGRTVRHEQFDEQGRLKRIINLGLMENKDKDSYYPENLAAHKDQIKVGQYLMFRVYEYDGTGKEQLVALSWYPRSPYDHLPNNVVDSAVKDAKRAWQNYRRPEKAAENNTFPPQFFGTPDGAVKWNDRDSFMKSFGFYETLNELKQWGEEQIKASK